MFNTLLHKQLSTIIYDTSILNTIYSLVDDEIPCYFEVPVRTDEMLFCHVYTYVVFSKVITYITKVYLPYQSKSTGE